jgi:YggT family protein
MDFSLLIFLINIVSQIFIWIVVASSLVSFILPPYHPIREALDRIVDPFLNPIRRMMPQTGAIDFSPIVLCFAIWVLSNILIAIFRSLS